MNGRIELSRRWWHGAQIGSVASADEVLNRRGDSVTPGVREMACRENQGATSFERAADRLREYVSARREMIRYPEFRKHGWQIGSGPTAAQCKLTVGRLPGRSRRWDRPNAAASAALDSLQRSGQWCHHFPTPCTVAA